MEQIRAELAAENVRLRSELSALKASLFLRKIASIDSGDVALPATVSVAAVNEKLPPQEMPSPDLLLEQLKQSTAALRSSEDRFSFALEAAGMLGWYDWDVPVDRMTANEYFARMFGVDPNKASSGAPLEDFFTGIHPDDRIRVGEEVAEATKAGGAFKSEYRLISPGGDITWVHSLGRVELDEAGKPLRFAGVVLDITARKIAEERKSALLFLGDTLRELTTIQDVALTAARCLAQVLGATRSGFGTVDDVAETVVMQPDWHAPGATSIAGLHRFRDYGSFIDDLKRGETVIIDDVARDPRTSDGAEALMGIGIRTLINVPILEARRFVGVAFVHYDRPQMFKQDDLAFMREVADRTQSAIAGLRSKAHQSLLNHELSHRLKNTLAMVQALSSQTLRGVADREAVATLEHRLQALGNAHEVLLEEDWSSARIGDIIAAALDGVGQLSRCNCSGPNLSIGPRSALSLSMMIHELCTNAVKYGSLSSDMGKVDIQWTLENESGGAEVRLRWIESNGPTAVKPDRRGFGTRLIGMGLAGTGGVELDYAASGLIADMRAPLEQLQTS